MHEKRGFIQRPRWQVSRPQGAQTWITQFNLQTTPCLPLAFVRIHQMALPQTAVTSSCSLLLIYRPQQDERLSWPYKLWVGVMTGPTTRKNWLMFTGDPFRYGFQITFPLPSLLPNSGFLDRSQISHSHRPIFTTLGEMTDANKVMNPQHFGSNPADVQIWIQLWLKFDALAAVVVLCVV